MASDAEPLPEAAAAPGLDQAAEALTRAVEILRWLSLHEEAREVVALAPTAILSQQGMSEDDGRRNLLQRSEPLGFFDQAVEVPSHICLFYYDDAELRERLPFLHLGLEAVDEAVVLFGPQPRLRQILGYLADATERDIDRDLSDGKIVLVEGAPTADEILSNIGVALDALVARSVRLIRFFGFIGWQDPDWPPTDDLLAFEASVNRAVEQYPVITVCTYRLTDLPGPTLIFGGIQTHPLTIIGQTLCENPHYLAAAADTGPRARGLHADAASLENVRLLRGSGDEPGR